MGKLREYRRKRDFEQTPEPGAKAAAGRARRKLPRFVVQQHHARRLHWDFRLEREGVLVSWAVPKGVPPDPKRNNLAVHVEDHPLGYIDFAGEIPKGNYGAGKVSIFDEGVYETHKWEMAPGSKGEVMVTLHGKRLEGRYVLFQTKDENWMIHRMDPPQDEGYEAMPESVVPMMAKLADAVPHDDDAYGYEFKWDGIRAVAFSQGGRLRLMTRNQEEVTFRYPELRALAESLGAHEAVLDGEIVAIGPRGIPSFEQLQQRMGLNSETEIRKKMKEVPVAYMIFDVVYLDGHLLTGLPYVERRKRLDSRYEAGRRSAAWLKVKNHLRQELVIGGWLEGQGRRKDLGALLVGYHSGSELVYAGKVGTGFDDRMLDRLLEMLGPLERRDSPFTAGAKPPRGSRFAEPKLVAEFQFAEWTRAGQLRAPVFKGLRSDKDPRSVVREKPVDA